MYEEVLCCICVNPFTTLLVSKKMWRRWWATDDRWTGKILSPPNRGAVLDSSWKHTHTQFGPNRLLSWICSEDERFLRGAKKVVSGETRYYCIKFKCNFHAEIICENCANPSLLQVRKMCVNNIALRFFVYAENRFEQRAETKREVIYSKSVWSCKTAHRMFVAKSIGVNETVAIYSQNKT
jgi:hypothetical protein